MGEGILRDEFNSLDRLEDDGAFYDYHWRRLAETGPKGKKLRVLAPVFRGPREKIVAGPIPAGYDGYLRLPKYTQRAIYRPSGSVSIRGPRDRQPYYVHVRNEGHTDAYLSITCIGSWG